MGCVELRGFGVELRGFWCGTEGGFGVELSGFRCGTEEFWVLKSCGPCGPCVEPMC